jgi:protein phosphatase
MGSTLSVALTLGPELIIVHLGDSRVYLLRGGRLHRLTRDHTANRLRASPGGAAQFVRVLTHAIGLHTGSEPQMSHHKLADGDRLLLCTDGLTDMADDELIRTELERAASAAAACQALVDLALDRGGRDNVTVVVASYGVARDPGPPAAVEPL